MGKYHPESRMCGSEKRAPAGHAVVCIRLAGHDGLHWSAYHKWNDRDPIAHRRAQKG